MTAMLIFCGFPAPTVEYKIFQEIQPRVAQKRFSPRLNVNVSIFHCFLGKFTDNKLLKFRVVQHHSSWGRNMKVLVPVKRVIDYNVKVRVKADGSGVDLANVKMSMNPFDEIAVEQAIRLKEAGQADEVIAVSIGVKQNQETLRTALAMGADRAILVVATEDVHTDIEPLAVAKILKAVIDEENPGIVLAGKQAIDNDMNATGQMLAALTGWSQATFVSELSVEGNSAVVTREVDGGLQTIKVTMPTIVTVDLRLNEPRYASLPNIMKAKKKPLDEKSAEDLGVDVTPRLKIESTGEPEARLAGIKVGSVEELVEKLKEVGAV